MSTQSPPNTQSASAEYTKPCGGRPSGWHDIVTLTCQRLVVLGVNYRHALLVYELKMLQVTQGRSRSFKITPVNTACVISY